ncbi:hypothetical protein PENTCL1PPCAC_14362, partial [Pristionchus entomophagus]
LIINHLQFHQFYEMTPDNGMILQRLAFDFSQKWFGKRGMTCHECTYLKEITRICTTFIRPFLDYTLQQFGKN